MSPSAHLATVARPEWISRAIPKVQPNDMTAATALPGEKLRLTTPDFVRPRQPAV